MTTPPRSPGDAAALLLTAVGASLEALANLRRLPPGILDGSTETALRRALSFQPPTARDPRAPVALGAAAVCTACAHLAAHAWIDAYQSLHVAQDQLVRFPPASPGPEASMGGDGAP